jgi:hypothetical protein
VKCNREQKKRVSFDFFLSFQRVYNLLLPTEKEKNERKVMFIMAYLDFFSTNIVMKKKNNMKSHLINFTTNFKIKNKI